MSHFTKSTFPVLVSTIAKLGATYLVKIAQQKLECLINALQQEQKRLVYCFLWICLGVGSAFLFLLFLAFTIVEAVPPQHRLLTLSLITLTFAIASCIAGIIAYFKLNQKSESLASLRN